VSYRPITDVMLLARPKVKYYGAFPSGFLSRAREQLGVGPLEPVLHVCGGRVRDYPFKGLGPNDKTVDLDPATSPDYLLDVRHGLPCVHGRAPGQCPAAANPEATVATVLGSCDWPAILIDRPYTTEDAAKYVPGADKLPALNELLKMALKAVPVGRRVGTLDYLWPHPGKIGREVGVFAVGTGRNARARWFVVFERIEPK